MAAQWTPAVKNQPRRKVSHEELALRFLPRLDPLAHALTLTFRGTNEEVLVDLRLEPADMSQRNDHWPVTPD
jgi:hypothetical protein